MGANLDTNNTGDIGGEWAGQRSRWKTCRTTSVLVNLAERMAYTLTYTDGRSQSTIVSTQDITGQAWTCDTIHIMTSLDLSRKSIK